MMKSTTKRIKTVGIIGAGAFGTGAARELVRLGHEVLVVDRDERALESLAAVIPRSFHSAIGNAESYDFLVEVGFKDVDMTIVAIGGNETAANHSTINCKDLGKYAVAKAIDNVHGTILERLGADMVVYPEHDSGVRLARLLIRTAILDRVELADEMFMVETEARGFAMNRTLEDLDLPGTYGVQVILIRRNGKAKFPIDPREKVTQGDVLVCVGRADALTELANHLGR